MGCVGNCCARTSKSKASAQRMAAVTAVIARRLQDILTSPAPIALKEKHSSHRIVWQYDKPRPATGQKGKVRVVALITIAFLLSARAPAAQSSAAENFYRGHSISMIIGFGVGGGYDLYGRLISRFMGKYLPGNPAIVPQNMTGAGSLRAVNYLYSVAPKDGSVIGTFSRTLVLAPLLNAADFDSRKFTWLGSVAQDVVVCFTSHASPIRTWPDFLSTPSSLGGEGATAEPDIYALFMKKRLRGESETREWISRDQ